MLVASEKNDCQNRKKVGEIVSKKMSLEERCIASFRKGLLRADSAKYRDLWHDALVVKGGNENGIFEDVTSRDIIAYISLRYFFLQNLTVFGGFVRSHFSGKPWNDVDIMMSKQTTREQIIDLIGHLTDFISIIMGFPKYFMSYTLHSQTTYGNAIDFKVKTGDRDDIVIKFDLVKGEQTRQLYTAIPVTIGSCLEMTNTGVVRLRRNIHIQKRLSHWNVNDITDYLEDGKDIKLCLKTSYARFSVKTKEFYQSYYWCRITKMLSLGWELLGIDGEEPPKLSHEDLQKNMMKLIVQKTNLARNSGTED